MLNKINANQLIVINQIKDWKSAEHLIEYPKK